jgi:predicted transcriptional regulator
MILQEQREPLVDAIRGYNLLPKGQKDILIKLLDFEEGITMQDLVNIMNQSKQTLFLKVKKLLDKQFIIREKDMVYIYKINSSKMLSILDRHITLKSKQQ